MPARKAKRNGNRPGRARCNAALCLPARPKCELNDEAIPFLHHDALGRTVYKDDVICPVGIPVRFLLTFLHSIVILQVCIKPVKATLFCAAADFLVRMLAQNLYVLYNYFFTAQVPPEMYDIFLQDLCPS